MVDMATEAPQTDSPETAQGNCLMGNLGWMLDQANHALGCEVAAALAPLDLGQRGFCVLSAAVDAELTQTELAGLIGLDKTTMVVTVDDLERKGLALRVPSPTDRRARVIKVTDAGREKVSGGAADRPGRPERRARLAAAVRARRFCGRAHETGERPAVQRAAVPSAAAAARAARLTRTSLGAFSGARAHVKAGFGGRHGRAR